MEKTALDDQYHILVGKLPDELIPDESLFADIWNLHPEEFHDIRMHGKIVKTPRWQQAYNKDYQYSGSKNNALPIPDVLQDCYSWGREKIDSRLNGLLLNWYDGKSNHYIGKHRDSTKGLVDDSPIVTISMGEQRVFRLRPWKGKGFTDFPVSNGSVIVVPYDTNLAWTHEVPAAARLDGRRISLTLRVFL